jgi:hypothetical protein
MRRGFSTLEILIAFAVMSLVFGGVMLADFSSAYWIIASQTSNEGLYKAKTRLEDLRAASKQDFYLASSSPAMIDTDASCKAGGLCYVLENRVTDISTCSKYLQAVSSWKVSGYPTTTASLPTYLANPAEAIALGGDCALNPPAGKWNGIHASSTAMFSGTPTGIDALGGVAYIATNVSPYLLIYREGEVVSYDNHFSVSDPVNGLDVARDEATGRTYAFLALASTTGQLAVVDVTDAAMPVEAARVSLADVNPASSFPQGWRVRYYGQMLYVTTRETATNEFHIFNVSNPAAPNEVKSYQLDTSVYDLAVRDEKAGGTMHRLAYLATTKGSAGKLLVLDVTDPVAIHEIAGAASTLPANLKSIALAGHTVYAGTDNVSGGSELYALDASNVLSVAGGLPVLSSGEVGSGVIGLKAAGGYLFVLARSGTKPLVSGLLDVDGDAVYIAQNTGKYLRVWDATAAAISQKASISVSSAPLQLYESN